VRGQLLEVVAGRKIRPGTVGRCIWRGHTRFGECVRLEFDDGGTTSSVIVSIKNVRPLEGQPVQQNLFGPVTPANDPGDIPF
jgi:hypothetical protein